MLGHWLRHYIVGVGVLPAHTSINLHVGEGWLGSGSMGSSTEQHLVNHSSSNSGAADAPSHASAPSTVTATGNVERALTLLRSYRIDAIRLDTERYTDGRRYVAIREFLRSLPADAWAIYADADEFFSYPCAMQSYPVFARDGVVPHDDSQQGRRLHAQIAYSEVFCA